MSGCCVSDRGLSGWNRGGGRRWSGARRRVNCWSIARALRGHRFAWNAAEEVIGLTRADLDITTRVAASLG